MPTELDSRVQAAWLLASVQCWGVAQAGRGASVSPLPCLGGGATARGPVRCRGDVLEHEHHAW